MPKFFLDIEYDDASTCDDLEGSEHQSVADAVAEARRGLKSLICETIALGGTGVATRVRVRDERGVSLGGAEINEIMPLCIMKALRCA